VIEIRSYRRVFDLERRIYRVDRLRLNPGGVPVRGVVYLLLIIFAAMIIARLPVLGWAARALPWYLRDVLVPGAMAAILSVIRVEGRPFHLAASALLRFRLAANRHSAFCQRGGPAARWDPAEILFLPDGSEGRMRNIRYTGPGAVLVARQHERAFTAPRLVRPGAADLIVSELASGRPLDRAQVIAIGPHARLRVRAAPARPPAR
jgi:hypothetical protein